MNKIAFAVSMLVGAQAMDVQDFIGFEENTPFHHDVERTEMGHRVETHFVGETEHKTVHVRDIPFAQDYAAVSDFMKDITDYHREKKQTEQAILMGTVGAQAAPIYTCATRAPQDKSETVLGDFLPVFAAQLTPDVPEGHWKGTCMDFHLKYTPVDATTFQVDVTTSNAESLTCYDYIMFGNAEFIHFEQYFGAFASRKNASITFKMPTADSAADIAHNGITAFGVCHGIVKELKSLVRTLEGFLGGLTDNPDARPKIISSHVPAYMEKQNIAFMDEVMQYSMEERTTQEVDIDPSLIQSGDYIAVMRLDGLDQIIMYGTGSHSGHSLIALRFDGELYICESQDAWYWPTHGLQRTKWDTWMKQAKDADFHVVWMPLSEEYRSKFDEAKAQEWFFKTEGLPYGYHNFLYGWIDTATENYPPFLANHIVPVLFSQLENIAPKTVEIFFNQALNKRLETTGLTVPEIAAEAARRGMSIEDVMAIPEQDGWEYTGLEPRDGEAMVCSAYVAAMWKAAGMFGEFNFNATEWATKDVYIVKFFDENREMPAACQAADPDNKGICQILGKYRMTFPEFNHYAPYENMFDKCGSLWPTYTRADGC